jgi:hypothetical protein
MEESTVIELAHDPVAEERYQKNLFVLLSFPRSGSHWVRRMLGEITAIRSGLSATFGASLNHTSGFFPPAINVDAQDWQTPMFVATHEPTFYPVENVRVFLRRNFKDVLKSVRKAEADVEQHGGKMWFGGEEERVRVLWNRTTAFGCTHADLVVDYEMTKQNPATTILAITKLAGMDITDDELQQALEAGSRENMLREQSLIEKRKWDVINKERVA